MELPKIERGELPTEEWRYMRRAVVLLLCAASLAVLLAGCSGEKTDSGGKTAAGRAAANMERTAEDYIRDGQYRAWSTGRVWPGSAGNTEDSLTDRIWKETKEAGKDLTRGVEKAGKDLGDGVRELTKP